MKMREDRKAGLKNERKATLLKAKIDWRGGTLLGGIKRRINEQMTAGVKDAYKNKRVKLGEDRVKQILKGRQDRREKRQAKRNARRNNS